MAPECHIREEVFLAMLTSLSAQQLESLSSLASDCTLKVATIGESISEFEVFKLGCVSHCCLLVSTRRWVVSLCRMVTKVTCFTKVRMVRRKSMHGSRRKCEIHNNAAVQLRTKRTTCTTSTRNREESARGLRQTFLGGGVAGRVRTCLTRKSRSGRPRRSRRSTRSNAR